MASVGYIRVPGEIEHRKIKPIGQAKITTARIIIQHPLEDNKEKIS